MADLARERDRHLTTARAVQIPKYGQIRTESRLFRVHSSRHLASHADVLRLRSSPRTSAERSDHFRSLAISQS